MANVTKRLVRQMSLSNGEPVTGIDAVLEAIKRYLEQEASNDQQQERG